MNHSSISVGTRTPVSTADEVKPNLRAGRFDEGGSPAINWDYERREIVADGIVHALGIALAPVAIAVMLWLAAGKAGPWEFGAVALYGGALLTVLIVSALYNLWPVSPFKWALRRFDHSAIYLLIAGTYTPVLFNVSGGVEVPLLLTGVWATSLAGADSSYGFQAGSKGCR